jgi:DNA-binding transcriptional ArsR family regulator
LYKQSLVYGDFREVAMPQDAAALDRTFHALADPNRRAILSVVRNQRCAVGEIAGQLRLSQQVVSHHLKVLNAADLVTGSWSGTRHLFAVQVDGLAVGREFLDEFWPERLIALKRAVESEDDSDDG